MKETIEKDISMCEKIEDLLPYEQRIEELYNTLSIEEWSHLRGTYNRKLIKLIISETHQGFGDMIEENNRLKEEIKQLKEELKEAINRLDALEGKKKLQT